jgi:hypothetical protein
VAGARGHVHVFDYLVVEFNHWAHLGEKLLGWIVAYGS